MDKVIFLVGLPGCGKTTLGRMLAARVGGEFIDLDAWIEKKEKRSITEIFATEGEEGFRQKETEALRRTAAVGLMQDAPEGKETQVPEARQRKPVIIATGGGTVLREENRDIMRAQGRVLYVKREVDAILRNLKPEARPLLAHDPQHLRKLADERLALYESVCHATLENTGTIAEAVDILAYLAGL